MALGDCLGLRRDQQMMRANAVKQEHFCWRMEINSFFTVSFAVPGTSTALQSQTQEVTMLTDKQQKKFSEFYDSARHNGVLEAKTTLLLHLGAAMAVGCIPL
jgi:hypothetical protein